MATGASSWATEVIAVLTKDARSEYRKPASLNAILLFALTTLMVIGPSFNLSGMGPHVKAPILASLLWIVLFFSAMSGLPRVFVKEEDSRTATALRLSAQPNVVYVGKLLFNTLLLLAMGAVIVPLFAILMKTEVRRWDQLVAVLTLGGAALAGASTLLAAIVSRTSNRGPLFGVLAFPILLPLLICAINATIAAFLGTRPTEVTSNLTVLATYLIATLTASLMLFEYVWNE